MFSENFDPRIKQGVDVEKKIRRDHVTLEWSDLCVTCRDRKLISNVSGSVKPGTLLAIMGGSGAGKSRVNYTVFRQYKFVLHQFVTSPPRVLS